MSGPEDLTCRELVELVTQYLDGALAVPDHVQFEQHLVLCTGCQNHLSQMRQTLRVLETLPGEDDVAPEAMAELLHTFRAWHTAGRQR
jgi:predicted anti-sigma-YlaC factor YlaD